MKELNGTARHKLNNLLGVILGYSEIIEHDLGAEHPMSMRIRELQRATRDAIEVVRLEAQADTPAGTGSESSSGAQPKA